MEATAMRPDVQDSFLSPGQAFNLCGISASTGWRLVKAGQFPRFSRIGPKTLRISEKTVRQFVAGRAR